MEKQIFKVNPIVIYPECILENGVQGDCFTCPNKPNCISPRSMCINPYKNHKYGCPNYGKLPTCPPNIPCMFDQMFDVSDVYAIVTRYNLYRRYEELRMLHPDWAEGNIRNPRYWQSTAIKNNDIAIAEFLRYRDELEAYVSTRLLECMGVQVVDTMKPVGLNIKFPPGEWVYRVAFVAKAYKEAMEKYGFMIKKETTKEKRGMRSLVKKL